MKAPRLQTRSLVSGTALFVSGILLLIGQALKGCDLQNDLLSTIPNGVGVFFFTYALFSGMPASALMMAGLKLLYSPLIQHWEALAHCWILLGMAAGLWILFRGINRSHSGWLRNRPLLQGLCAFAFMGLSAFFARIFSNFDVPFFIMSAILILPGLYLIGGDLNQTSQNLKTKINPAKNTEIQQLE